MNPYREPGLSVEAAPTIEHTVESLMKLIAEVSGHGYESSRVNIGYMRARVFTAQDESHLDDSNWGYTASTTIFGEKDYDGKPQTVSAQGPDLIFALKNLAREIVDVLTRINQKRAGAAEMARSKLLDARL